ncbi:MAG: retropepsin-like domain-containing protein [Dysgonamonadaceae bacterium]|jgi:hypothetical protein|nr:retropepsin-like domain-containing protein [Dysgonamonadaceae bacterium]
MPAFRTLLATLILTFPCLLRAGSGECLVIPFQLSEKGVILKIRLNDCPSPLSFLLDTGADGMAIRKSLADSLQLEIGYAQDAYFVGGKKEIQISTGNKVFLSDSLSLTEQNIAIFDEISNMDGIIGLNLLKHYVTRFDFDKDELQLYLPDTFTPPADTLATLPITMNRSLLLIAGELNLTGKSSVKGNFLLDTGAHYHLIAFTRFVRKNRLLLSGFKPEGMSSTVSMGHATPVYYGKANRFVIGNNLFMNDMPITLQASSGSSAESADEKAPDGSIGILFFKRYNFTINLPKKEVYLEKRLSDI